MTTNQAFDRRSYYRHLLSRKRWRELRARVLIAVMHRCQDCGRAQATEVHHIQPVQRANNMREMVALCYDPANLVALCHDCHQRRHLDKMDAAERSRQTDALIEAKTRALFDK